jgi:hypothetical protein
MRCIHAMISNTIMWCPYKRSFMTTKLYIRYTSMYIIEKGKRIPQCWSKAEEERKRLQFVFDAIVCNNHC